MPFFLPAFDKTPDWVPISDTPTAIIIKFDDYGDIFALHRFIEVFIEFIELNQGTGVLHPMPIVRNADGKDVPIGLLALVRKHHKMFRLSFYLFGDYFREMLRIYCMRSLSEYHENEEVYDAFKRLLRMYELGDGNPTLN